jgi:hypothetical protein
MNIPLKKAFDSLSDDYQLKLKQLSLDVISQITNRDMLGISRDIVMSSFRLQSMLKLDILPLCLINKVLEFEDLLMLRKEDLFFGSTKALPISIVCALGKTLSYEVDASKPESMFKYQCSTCQAKERMISENVSFRLSEQQTQWILEIVHDLLSIDAEEGYLLMMTLSNHLPESLTKDTQSKLIDYMVESILKSGGKVPQSAM